MNRVFSCHINSFGHFRPGVCYPHIVRLGIRNVELPCTVGYGDPWIVPEIIDDIDFERLKAELAEHGLGVPSISAHCHLDRDSGVEFFKHRVDFAARLGTTIVITGTGRDVDTQAKRQRQYDLLRGLGDYAGERGVLIALEVHPGLTTNATVCRETIDKVAHPNVRINYDTGNVFYYNDDLDPAEDVKLIAEHVAHVHLEDSLGKTGEWAFPALGDGKVDFPGVFATLEAVGFSGPYSIEIEGRSGESPTLSDRVAEVERSVAYLRRIGVFE